MADKPNYWEIRRKLEKALREKDNKTLKELASLYPDIVFNMARFAKNQMKRVYK